MCSFLFPDMKKRCMDPELMDMANADTERLIRTIRQFGLINFLFSGSRRFIRKYFFSEMRKSPEKEYSILDIGAGGCDIMAWTAREARKLGLKISITAIDNDERIIPAVSETIKDFPEINLIRHPAAHISSLGRFDFIFSNHFLHHLDWNEIGSLLKTISGQTNISFLMNDLARSPWGYLGYTVFTGLFIHGSFAFNDGRLSVQRGFLPEELRKLIRENLPDINITVAEYMPSRIVIYGRGKTPNTKKMGTP